MGKASRLKRQKKQQTAAQRAMMERVQRSLPDERISVVKRAQGRKVSDILMEFAKPWLDEARNDTQTEGIIGMAVLAWNMSLLPETERWEGTEPRFLERFGERGKAIINEMIARKLALYAREARSILDYEVTGSGGHLRVEVAYSLLPEEIAQLPPGSIPAAATRDAELG